MHIFWKSLSHKYLIFVLLLFSFFEDPIRHFVRPRILVKLVKRADDKSGGGVGGNQGGKKEQNDPLRDVFVKHSQPVVQPQQQGNKDDAYAQFMAEMEKMM